MASKSHGDYNDQTIRSRAYRDLAVRRPARWLATRRTAPSSLLRPTTSPWSLRRTRRASSCRRRVPIQAAPGFPMSRRRVHRLRRLAVRLMCPLRAMAAAPSRRRKSRPLATVSSARCRRGLQRYRIHLPARWQAERLYSRRGSGAPSSPDCATARGCSTPKTRASIASHWQGLPRLRPRRRGLQDHGPCLQSPGPREIYSAFAGVDGSAYLVGGVGVTFLADSHVILAPIRSGLGLRLGANIGYLKYTREPTWNPF